MSILEQDLQTQDLQTYETQTRLTPSGRVQAFEKHLKSLDYKTVKQVMHFLSTEWEGMVGVISGLKPAFVFEDEDIGFDVKAFIPPELIHNFVVSENGWIADIHAVSSIIHKHLKHYPDVETDRLPDTGYVKSYLEHRTCDTVEVDSDEIIKTGLLLGYPYDSVIAFAQGNKQGLVEFSGFGYNFSALPENKQYFRNKLSQIKKQSGLKNALSRISNRISQEFIKSLDVKQDTIQVIQIFGNNFLEIIGNDPTEGILNKQLLLLTDKPISQVSAELLVDTFGHRYQVRSMTITRSPEDGSVKTGVDFDDTIANILDHTGDEDLP